MAQLMDYAGYLAKEVGARPAGTEEEQQAALYITEQFQKEAGFTAAIEEFTNSTNLVASRAVLGAVVVAATVLAIIFPILNIPAFILAAAAAAIYAVEAFDRPVIARFLSRGASQNVVAKYQPNFEEPPSGGSARSRGRKVILVAHYDTGHVTPPIVERFQSSGLPLPLICLIAMIAGAFFQLLRIFMAPNGGMGLLVLNALSILAILVCLLPVVKALLVRRAPYNEGAVNNATGTAALIEVARRISRGSISEADLAQSADGDLRIHGEAAARDAGLVPEGVQIRYEAEQIAPPSELGEYDEEERLLAAKAAIAAMTGKPVERRVFGSVADNLVNSRAGGGSDEYVDPQSSPLGASSPQSDSSALGEPRSDTSVGGGADSDSMPATAEGFENAPSWFIAAQQNARKSQPDGAARPSEVQRSKYTEAMENAERERDEHAEELRALEQSEREEAARAALAASAAAVSRADASNVAAEPAEPAPAGQPIRRQKAELAGIEEGPGYPSPDQPVLKPASTDGEAASSIQSSSVPPNSTVAMGSPVSAAEVKAEAALIDAADNAVDNMAESDRSAPRESLVRERIAGLPSIDPASTQGSHSVAAASAPTPNPSRSGVLRKLRTNVPSLSGLIDPVSDTSWQENQSVSTPISSAAAANRAAARRAAAESLPSVVNVPTPIEPVSSSRARGGSPSSGAVDYNMEVDLGSRAPAQAQAQASARAQAPSQAQSQAQAKGGLQSQSKARASKQAPSQTRQVTPNSSSPAASSKPSSASSPMEVPRSRSANLLSRLHRDNNDLQETPQEWLEVDESYEARSVGRERGSWESFRDDQYFDDDESFDDFGMGESRRASRKWQGGAYSRMQLGHVDMRSGVDAEADAMIPEGLPQEEADRSLTGEIEQIYHFRNPQFDSEIWFVAVGSDTEGHDGVRAFLDEHRDELRGSMVIEVESLGAGELSVASEEGYIRKVTASSRIKRYTRAAVASTGIALDEVSLVGTDSIASTVQKAGFQAMHLFGAENGRPALKGSADDVLENVDGLLFDDNVNFVFELLKH